MDRILVVAPHPDDEILGCGATLYKHIVNNNEVIVVIATNANVGDPNLFSESQVKEVRKEARKAHAVLGVNQSIFLDFPAPALNAFPNYKIANRLAKIVEETEPNILYLPHPGDLHEDHNAIYRAGLVASRPQNSCTVRNIYCYETLSETEWSPIQGDNHFVPNHFEVVNSEMFSKKMEAIKCFESQLKKYPHSRSLKSLKALAQYRGSTVGVSFAEAFEVERQIKISNGIN